VEAWDRGLFGVHWHAVWRTAMPAPWLSEAMYFSYFLYYMLIALPPIAVALAARRDACRDMVLRLMATYLTCYLFSVAFPVLGPRPEGGAAAAAPGFFQALVARAQAAGDSLGTAFPSSHAAGAVTVAWIGCRWFRRPIAALLVVQGVLVLFATVYTQNHFAVDALVGAIWAISVQVLVVPALHRAVGRLPEPSAVSQKGGFPGRVAGADAA
jgi:membrane-associated phospholipid phosphatase